MKLNFNYFLRLFIILMKLFIILFLTVTFLLVMIDSFVSLVMYLGDDYHVIDHVKIYEVFQEKIYNKVRKEMMRQNYTILIGDDKSGVKNFIQHQANLRTLEGMAVVVKRYQSMSKSKQKIFNKVKQTRYYLEFALGLERKQRTQVFFVDSLQQVPYEEINFIKSKYPQDNIIIVSTKDVKIEIPDFKAIVFPPVSEKMLKVIIARYYHTKPQQIDKILERYDHNIEKLFEYFKRLAKQEYVRAQELIQINQIQDLNEISHQLALKQKKKLLQKLEKQKKSSKKGQNKTKSNKSKNKSKTK